MGDLLGSPRVAFLFVIFFSFVLAVPLSKVLSSPGGDERTGAVEGQRYSRRTIYFTSHGLGNESGHR